MNASNLYSTGIPHKEIHKLDGFPRVSMLLLLLLFF